MKIFDNLSKKTKVGLIISIVLCVLLLINSAVSVVQNFNAGRIIVGIRNCLGLVMIFVTIWYVLFGYKQPHGNSLRFAYFAFALYIGLHSIIDAIEGRESASCILMLIAALIIAYISGRLNKIEKNKKLLILVGLIFLADAIIHIIIGASLPFKLTRLFGHVTTLAYLVAFGFAYTARYEQHKEAGLEDKQ